MTGAHERGGVEMSGAGGRHASDDPRLPGAGRMTFDGRAVPFTAGQSVGAALWAAGVRSWRTTRTAGRPRGLFCGIGVCFDCMIEIDGQPDQLACLALARDGMILHTQEGAGSAPIER